MRDDRRCTKCGTSLSGSGSVEGLCTACLLGLGLSDPEATRSSSRDAANRPRTLEPVGAGVAASHWAMPAELLRQAARRLALAAAGLALAFAASIVLNNLFAAVGWYTYPHLAFLNVIHGTMVVVSVAMAWIARTSRLSPRQLLMIGLVYEIVFALGISLGDHLEPLPLEAPMHAISWLCLAIAIFPSSCPLPRAGPSPPRWLRPRPGRSSTSSSSWPGRRPPPPASWP